MNNRDLDDLEPAEESVEPPSSGARSRDVSGIHVDVGIDEVLDGPHEFDRQELTDRIGSAVQAAALQRGFLTGSIGVFVTGDESIREINRRHLQHDYATDVISFGYELNGDHVEGELTVSFEMAAAQAETIGWDSVAELLLYVVHGTLHITGMDDATDQQRIAMRRVEIATLQELGIMRAEHFHADRFAALDGLSDSTDVSRELQR